MPARKKKEPSPPAIGLSFEEALAQLESIVESMEGEQLPLEKLVAQYESGSALLKHCESVLNSAQKRIELITLSNTGELDHTAQSPLNSTDSVKTEPDQDNDISLF
ncbi:MAG: exodeoxyribonuclease VII small subunit [Luteolibacter sp.]